MYVRLATKVLLGDGSCITIAWGTTVFRLTDTQFDAIRRGKKGLESSCDKHGGAYLEGERGEEPA